VRSVAVDHEALPAAGIGTGARLSAEVYRSE
jgi:hypothetical protein